MLINYIWQMGNLYKDQGIYEKAVNYYQKVLEINPISMQHIQILENVYIDIENIMHPR